MHAVFTEESGTTIPPAARPPSPNADSIRFADCEVHIPSRAIFRGGVEQKVERLTFDLLVYLIMSRGRVVTKDELLRNVWCNMFVSESVITQGVMKARRVLGDDGCTRAFIRTVHCVGYKFSDGMRHAGPTDSEPTSPSPQWVLIARPTNLDEARQRALARAMDAVTRELARVGLVVRQLEQIELPSWLNVGTADLDRTSIH